MPDLVSLLDDIVKQLSSLRQEIELLRQSGREREIVEESLTHRNRIQGLLNSVRAQIVKKRTRKNLYDGVCKSFVESGLVHAAWIGSLDAESESVVPITSARIDEVQLGVSIVQVSPDIAIQGTIFDTVVGGDIFVSNDIASDIRLEAYHKSAEHQQYASLAVFPIAENQTEVSVLVLLSQTKDFFSDDVVKNVRRLCGDLSLGVQRLHRENELRFEIDALEETIMRYRIVSDQHFIGIAVIQGGKIKYANDAIADIFGYSVDELLAWEPNEFTKIIHPDDVESVTDPRRRNAREVDGITYYSYRIITGRNETREIHRYSKSVFYAGDHAHLLAVMDHTMHQELQTTAVEQPATDQSLLAQLLFDNSPYPNFLVDFNTFAILRVNTAAKNLYGYSDQEFRDMSFRDLYAEDEVSFFLDQFSQLPLTLQMEVMTRHRQRDGTDIDIELAARYLRIRDKAVALIVARDVTNKKWAEEVIRESETNYRNIFNSVGCMLLVIDRDARILDLNKAAETELQQQREEMIGRDFDFINANDKNTGDDFRNILDRAFESGEENFTWYLQKRDGQIFPNEINLRRCEYFGHEVIVAAAAKRHATDWAVTVTDELSATLESAPVALAIADSSGMFTWANQSFANLFGSGVEEIVNTDIESLPVVERNEETLKRIVQAVYKEKVWSDEITVKNGEGTIRDISLTVTPVETGTNSAKRFVFTARNITQEKEQMLQLLQKQKLESIDTISRAIAHDFNNILGIILGYASFLEKRKDDPEKFKADIEEIKNAVQRGANLIKQMLAYTHRNEISFELINVNDHIQNVIGVLRETFPPTIEISSELDQNVPHIPIHPHQLQQIVTELCINARHAIEDPDAENPGVGKIIIETRMCEGDKLREMFPAALGDTYIELRVTDTGIGMDTDTKNKVFDPFFSGKEYGKGKGLGLTAVYGVVKSYNGLIRVESEPKRGSVFVIYLPSKAELTKKADTEDIYPAGSETADEGTKTSRKTILVVEDEPSLLQLLRDILRENGYRVITAKDGIEAVKMYETYWQEIALVVSDVGLPKLDGFNAFLQMRRINQNVNAILASGYLDDKVKVDLHKEGIKEFLKKPYQTEEILTKINQLVKE
jgi:PAS domain S-box-containing protein